MFTDITLNNPNWSQQKNHGFLMDTRHVLDSFSFGSRSLLVSSSFVSRSSLVAYSLVYRRPNENLTRNKQKTNERATRLGRESNEKLSKTRRETIGLAMSQSFFLAPIQTEKLQFRKEMCLKAQYLSKFIRSFQEICIPLEQKTLYGTS